jgi:hypothetical protein
MVAIATPHPRQRSARPRLQAVPAPERSTGAVAGSAWSRVAAAVAAAVVVVGLALLALAGPATTAAGGEVPVLDATRVVAEGETMWSIAQDLAPAGETAVYAERLVEVNGGGAVEAGQVLVLPTP